ncbi:hypothetical protein AX769_16550 [Frondihabitans sp. PAMC 28766]|uniref:hypothetical protein n=1 Tax=Frondihabitans sp. PAMC 28766 TaxID=1795630 RepID=UPI00078C1626|nr:hypothetical protein [Frondihabitans sp. PAMC 28766]AMM21448.1 hypothetical protein AX769_16550 [Frondihabitans sp. PAMC 28766]
MNDIDITAPGDAPHSPRLTMMRDALVETVMQEAARPHRRLTRKAFCALLAAFVLAGGISGGLTAAAALGTRDDAVLAGGVATTGAYDMTEGQHGTLLGAPVSEITSGPDSLSLGDAPPGANAVAIGFQCVTAGRFTLTFASGLPVTNGRCRVSSDDEPSTTTPAGYSLRVDPSQGGVVKIVAAADARYAVWASWAKVPTPAKPSPAQLAEIADHKITRSEYVAAFHRYEKCMSAAGYDLGQIPDNETNFQYGIPGDGIAESDTVCYPREFEQVDDLWQAAHPQ